MRNLLKVDVGVVGGGVVGLFMVNKLTDLGLSVAVIERSGRLASEASTRNEGWGHRGTYHAAAIEDRRIALQVAKQTSEGYKQIVRFAPEVVEDPEAPALALLRNEQRIDEVKSRWDEAGIPYQEICCACLKRTESRVKTRDIAAAFEVKDVSLNTRRLFEKLRDHAQERGARFFTQTEVDYFKDYAARLSGPACSPKWLEARLYIHASGWGMKEFFRSKLSIELPLRFWKSHLLDLPRVNKHSIFCLDPGEATLMHHGEWSIAGSNADQVNVLEPLPDVNEAAIENLKQALQRLIEDVDLAEARARACIKVDSDPGIVDMCKGGYARPQLSIAFGEPIPGHIWMLPGKMTEAPYVADIVTEEVCNRLGARGCNLSDKRPMIRTAVAPRPIDTYS